MDWIVTTARTVEEAQTRALDLLGVDTADAEIQVIEEGKTGLFGRTKSEARVRARIKPKAPAAKEERRSNRNDRSRGRGKGGSGKSNSDSGSSNKGGSSNGGSSGSGGSNKGGGNRNRRDGGSDSSNKGGSRKKQNGGSSSANESKSNNDRNQGAKNDGGRNRSRGNRQRNDRDRNDRNNEDRVEMPVDEQRETLEAFVTGVATSFSSDATVTLVEEGTTLLAKVNGEDLGRLVGSRAATLQSLEELARTAMHRAAAGRRYHRIQVDVDDYRARRRDALVKFATDLAQTVADTGESKAMEPMGAADRKIVHDAVAQVPGVETVSEGRDPRRYIVLLATDTDEEEE